MNKRSSPARVIASTVVIIVMVWILGSARADPNDPSIGFDQDPNEFVPPESELEAAELVADDPNVEPLNPDLIDDPLHPPGSERRTFVVHPDGRILCIYGPALLSIETRRLNEIVSQEQPAAEIWAALFRERTDPNEPPREVRLRSDDYDECTR